MKKKEKEYLPLYWSKKLLQQLQESFPEGVTAEELLMILNPDHTEEEEIDFLEKHPWMKLLDQLGEQQAKECITEMLRDFDSIASVMLWQKNKQVFRLDKDFTNELVRTEDLCFVKDAYKFLPYKVFYVDISDNKELCQKILGDGFFIRPELSKDEKHWVLHICKIDEKYFYTDVIHAPNESDRLKTDLLQENAEIDLVDLHLDQPEKVFSKDKTVENTKLLSVLVVQLLTYLSSVEPDIHENPETKKTYRPPAKDAAPKNKYSEIQKWDVGVRYGTAYRNWENQKIHTHHVSNGESSGTRKRPHARRAHWHQYWYGKKGEDRVLRAKWVSEVFVNMKMSEETPAVVHKVQRGEDR